MRCTDPVADSVQPPPVLAQPSDNKCPRALTDLTFRVAIRMVGELWWVAKGQQSGSDTPTIVASVYARK